MPQAAQAQQRQSNVLPGAAGVPVGVPTDGTLADTGTTHSEAGSACWHAGEPGAWGFRDSATARCRVRASELLETQSTCFADRGAIMTKGRCRCCMTYLFPKPHRHQQAVGQNMQRQCEEGRVTAEQVALPESKAAHPHQQVIQGYVRSEQECHRRAGLRLDIVLKHYYNYRQQQLSGQ